MRVKIKGAGKRTESNRNKEIKSEIERDRKDMWMIEGSREMLKYIQ